VIGFDLRNGFSDAHSYYSVSDRYGARFAKYLKIFPKIIVRSIVSLIVSSPLVVLYDLFYSYRNCISKLSYDDPTINLIVR